MFFVSKGMTIVKKKKTTHVEDNALVIHTVMCPIPPGPCDLANPTVQCISRSTFSAGDIPGQLKIIQFNHEHPKNPIGRHMSGGINSFLKSNTLSIYLLCGPYLV